MEKVGWGLSHGTNLHSHPRVCLAQGPALGYQHIKFCHLELCFLHSAQD